MLESRRRRALLIVLTTIVLAGAAIRISASHVPRLNIDEGWAFYLVANSVEDVLLNLQKDRNPPLPYLLLKAIADSGSHDETRLRLPFAILGSLNVLLTVLLGGLLFGPAAAIGGGALSAISFIAWEYDTWMRGYVLLTFFTLLSTLCFVHLCRGGTRAWIAGYALSGTLLLYSHYMGILTLAAHVVTALLPDASSTWLPRRQRVRRALPAWLLMGALFAMWIPMMRLQAVRHAARGGLEATGDPFLAMLTGLRVLPLQTGLTFVPVLLRDALGAHLETARLWWDAAVTAACAGALAAGLRRLGPQRLERWLVILLMLPVALFIVMIGIKTPEMTRIRYYASAIPFVGMVLGSATAKRPRLLAVMAAGVVITNLAVLVSYLQTPYFRAADWRTPAMFAAVRQSQARIIVGFSNHAMYAFDYYLVGDEMHYDAREVDRPSCVYSPRHLERGGLPEMRLWPQEFPDILEERLRGLDAVILVLWMDNGMPALRDWFRERFDVVDGVFVDNFDTDGRSMTFLLRRKQPAR